MTSILGRFFRTAWLAAFAVATVLSVHANELQTTSELLCRHAHFAAPPAPGVRNYAPERQVDILHLAIDVTPNFKLRTVAGNVTLTFKPIVKPLTELHLDAVDLTIERVECAEKLTHNATDREITFVFANAIPVGKETKLTIHYRAEPKKGLYFRTPEMGYPATDMHLFTQGETTEARHWYPCYDHPNDKFTSEVTCRVALTSSVVGRSQSRVSKHTTRSASRNTSFA